MIAVIADDFTGAAEIGGIALRYGLTVVMDTKVPFFAEEDVVVIATNTRSLSQSDAFNTVVKVTEELILLEPDFIFKKTDSLLRGNVGAELEAQLKAEGKKQALLIPANPALGRTVREGVYYYNDFPLHLSKLADASHIKIKESSVMKLMGEEWQNKTSVASIGENFDHAPIVIGNTVNEKDLQAWAKCLNKNLIPSGSGGFFDAVLAGYTNATSQEAKTNFFLGKNILYVCGSPYPQSKQSVIDAQTAGTLVSYMPENIFCKDASIPDFIIQWSDEILQRITSSKKVIMAVNNLNCFTNDETPVQIRKIMATVIDRVMQKINIDELMIEGGATAFAITEILNYKQFFPSQELAQGVIRMKVRHANGLHITLKPGSYAWPSSIWKTAS
ncbi:MAG: four-carbon acid sugar kinase family protein [Ginsengibacter sp.]